jgi:hypothetical protein
MTKSVLKAGSEEEAQRTAAHRDDYATTSAQLDEALQLADEKDAVFWKALGMMRRACVLALTGKPSDAVETMTSGINTWRSTGSTTYLPLYLTYLARVFAMIVSSMTLAVALAKR